MSEQDTYKTLLEPSDEVIYKEKKSKFLGYAFPITSEEEAKSLIEHLKTQHHSARHWCYAYQLGLEESELIYRANDDGEPNNSAGMPIYGQIQSFGVTNVLIVVVRYFGGVKLGVGGLISAYKTTAQMAMEASKIVELTIEGKLSVTFGYPLLNKVMQIIKKENLTIHSQTMELSCEVILSVRKNNLSEIHDRIASIHGVTVKEVI